MNNIAKCGYGPTFTSLIDEVFERAAVNNAEMYYKPAANVSEDQSGFKIELALPGFEKEEISMKLEKNQLLITAGREKKESDKENRYSWNEFGKTGKYRRAFILPETINVEAINAAYRNGVLHIELPANEVQPNVNREITIA